MHHPRTIAWAGAFGALAIVCLAGCGNIRKARPHDAGIDRPPLVDGRGKPGETGDGARKDLGNDPTEPADVAGETAGDGHALDLARDPIDTDTRLDALGEVASVSPDTAEPWDVVVGIDANIGGEGEAGGVAECADDNPCTVDRFDGTTCIHTPAPNGLPCSDGDLCTLADRCEDGICVGGTAQHGAMAELGRVEAFGTEEGLVLPTGDDRILFVDPAYPKTVVHSTRIVGDGLTVDGADNPRSDQPFAFIADNSSMAHTGWPGYAAFGWTGGDTVSLITVDGTGKPVLHERFELQLSQGFLSGSLNGLVGSQTGLWVCVNYASFGPAAGTLVRYDLADPDAPIDAQVVPLTVKCGSLAISSDGKRVYANTPNGVLWFDATATDAQGNVTIKGPFGANSGLWVYGSTLLARGTTAAVLYNEADQSELLRVEQPGLVGATYLPSQQVLVLMRQEQVDGGYRRWLQVRDAKPTGGGALLDEVLLDIGAITAARIPTSDDVVFDFRSKAAFRVEQGKLKRLSLPMLGGLGALAADVGTLSAWSPTAWRALDVSDLAHPSFTGPGGPVIGRQRALGLDIGSAETILIDDPGYVDNTMRPRLGVVSADSSYAKRNDALVLALRDGKAWAETTDKGQVLLAGSEPSTLAWSSDSLFRVSSQEPGQLRLRRWDRALLVPSEVPVQPREDRTFAIAGMPSGIKASSTLDFPAHGDVGLAVASYALTLDGSIENDAALLWIDHASPQSSLLEQVSVTGLRSAIDGCRVAGERAVCSGFDMLILVERGAQPRQIRLGTESFAILAFDGKAIYLSRSDGLQVVSFDRLASEQPADGGLVDVAAPLVRFSHYPLAIAETPGGLVVASAHEAVVLSPECAGR
jgi:hypothetical protein